MYLIQKLENTDDTEQRVEGLRKQRRADEKKRQDEKNKAGQDKKKDYEVVKTKANNKEMSRSPTLSYDFQGNAVPIQLINKFPTIVSECGKSALVKRDNADPSPSKQLRPRRATLKAKEDGSENPPKPEEDEWGREVHAQQKPDNDAFNSMAVVYEALVPAVGVTFTESGKNPKASTETHSEKSGKPNKADYYSTLAEHSMRVSASLPSLFPDINPKKVIVDVSVSRDISGEDSMKIGAASEGIKSKRAEPTMAVDYSKESQTINDSKADVSQILISNPQTYAFPSDEEPSLLPKLYIPPSFRKAKGRISPIHLKTRTFDTDMVNPELSTSSRKMKLDPIIKGRRASPRLIRETIGGFKKLPRERKFQSGSHYYKLKLPPPPIGQTYGHGVVEI